MLRLSCLLAVIKTFFPLLISLTHTQLTMFSLIRKISSQQHKDNMTEDAKTDVDDKQEDQQQQEEVDGTSYDPHADPRDPGSYYTFPHFADE
jgi:hypothetical protein